MRRASQHAAPPTVGLDSKSAAQNNSASRIQDEFRQSMQPTPFDVHSEFPVSAGRVLLVDNNPQIRWVVRNALRSNGYSVSEARSGEEALEMLQRDEYDLVLLDMHTPGVDVERAPREIRSRSDSAILVFRERETDGSQAEAPSVGADDYLPKPFTRGELLARLRAVLDKGPAHADAVTAQISLPDLEIDFLGREVRADGRESRLTPKEFRLLSYLVTHPNKVIRGRELLEAVWGPDQENKTDCLRVIVNRLRDKIEPDRAKPRYLLTEPWVGYRFCMPRKV